jgi:hypothetical protein
MVSVTPSNKHRDRRSGMSPGTWISSPELICASAASDVIQTSPAPAIGGRGAQNKHILLRPVVPELSLIRVGPFLYDLVLGHDLIVVYANDR